VGTTDSNQHTATSGSGISLRTDGRLNVTSTEAVGASTLVAAFNRISTDGNILSLRKDGSAVGTIGSVSGSMYINTGSAGGIYLGGSGSSNYLDDYEEGTWAPTVFTSWTTNPTIASSNYVKIGRLVILSLQFSAGVTGTQAYISGLPFSATIDGGGTGVLVNGGISQVGAVMASSGNLWFTARDTTIAGCRVVVTYQTP